MQDMIKQIVDMDRQAREITDAAQLEKVNSEKEVAEKREEIRNQFLERARHRIAMNEPVERNAAEEAWKAVEAKNKQTAARLDGMYSEKGDEWVAAIVARVTGK